MRKVRRDTTASLFSTTIATTIIPPLPIRITLLPRARQDLDQSAGTELENGVAVCLSTLRPIVQINSEASECLSPDSITEATLGSDIMLCLSASLISAAVGPTSSATLTTTTSSTPDTTTTTTSIYSTTSTSTTIQTTTPTTTSSSTTTSPASPTCGATGCSNGPGVINVSAGRTLAQCNELCDADVLCTAIQFDQDTGACTLLSLPALLVLDLESIQACATLFYDESCDIPADPVSVLSCLLLNKRTNMSLLQIPVNGGFEDLVDTKIGVGGITAGGWTLSDTNVRFSANSAVPVECVEALPAACIALEARNGLALLVDVPNCISALALNLNAEASICLDTGVIGLVTAGQSIVNCLNAAIVRPRGSTYSTPSGSGFVTVFADPGQLYSIGQTIDNVPAGLGNENTITYSHNYAGTRDPNDPTSCTVNVLYAGDIIDDFALEASGSGWITRSQTFSTDSVIGELVLQVDCSASTTALRDVLFDDILIASRPILEVEGAT